VEDAEVEREARAELAADVAGRARRLENRKLAHEATGAELASRLAMLRASAGFIPGAQSETQLAATCDAELDAAVRMGEALAAAAAGGSGGGSVALISEADAEAVLNVARDAARRRRNLPGSSAPGGGGGLNLEPVLSTGSARDEGSKVRQ
jgi:hypothetical protein